MSEINERPIIFPLSNPTSLAECTFEQAMKWSDERVVFASGSPFPPIKRSDGSTVYPAQANNAYIFPAVGHAAILTQCSSITEELFLLAAECLGAMSNARELEGGWLFPPFSKIKSISSEIMALLCDYIVANNMGSKPAGTSMVKSQADWNRYIQSVMWPVGKEGAMQANLVYRSRL
eukprot:gene26824-4418_t